MEKGVQLIKFANGEEIVAEVTDFTADTLTFRHPIRLLILPPDATGKPKIGFDQYLPYIKERIFHVDRIQVLFVMTPIRQFIDEYDRITDAIDPLKIKKVKSKLIMP